MLAQWRARMSGSPGVGQMGRSVNSQVAAAWRQATSLEEVGKLLSAMRYS